MRLAVGLPFGAVALTAACFSYRPAPLPPAPGAQVRLYLTARTTLTIYGTGRNADTVLHPGVIGLDGAVLDVTADTLTVEVHALRMGPGAALDIGLGRLARVPMSRVGQVEEHRFAAGRVALLAFVAFDVAAVAWLTYVLAMMLSW